MSVTSQNQRPLDLSILECPGCGGYLALESEAIKCMHCLHVFQQVEGIQQLFWPNVWTGNRVDVTDLVKAFYEDNPFPNYDTYDSVSSLAGKAEKGLFARMLDEQIPAGTRIIECGCGTG